MESINAQASVAIMNDIIIAFLNTADDVYIPGRHIVLVLGLTPENLIPTLQEHLGEDLPFQSVKWKDISDECKLVFDDNNFPSPTDDLPNPTWAFRMDVFHELILRLAEQGNHSASVIRRKVLFEPINAQASLAVMNDYMILFLRTPNNGLYIPVEHIGLVLGLTPENFISTFQEHLGENLPLESVKWEWMSVHHKLAFDQQNTPNPTDVPLNPTWAFRIDVFQELVLRLSEQGNHSASVILCRFLFASS